MTTVVVTFVLVYLGMLLGGLPFLQLDRTGIAVLGTIALLVTESVSMEEAGRAIHMQTLILLFSFMVIAAQLRLGGFYDWITRGLGTLSVGAPALLALSNTLAGNLLVVGSIANIIVIDAAARREIHIGWWEHARIGVPVTLTTLGISAAYLLR